MLWVKMATGLRSASTVEVQTNKETATEKCHIKQKHE